VDSTSAEEPLSDGLLCSGVRWNSVGCRLPTGSGTHGVHIGFAWLSAASSSIRSSTPLSCCWRHRKFPSSKLRSAWSRSTCRVSCCQCFSHDPWDSTGMFLFGNGDSMACSAFSRSRAAFGARAPVGRLGVGFALELASGHARRNASLGSSSCGSSSRCWLIISMLGR